MSCKDDNASPDSASNNPFENIRCKCNEGFISSSSSGVKTLLDDSEFCVPVLASSNIDTTHDTITIKMDPDFRTIEEGDLTLLRHGKLATACNIFLS